MTIEVAKRRKTFALFAIPVSIPVLIFFFQRLTRLTWTYQTVNVPVLSTSWDENTKSSFNWMSKSIKQKRVPDCYGVAWEYAPDLVSQTTTMRLQYWRKTRILQYGADNDPKALVAENVSIAEINQAAVNGGRFRNFAAYRLPKAE